MERSYDITLGLKYQIAYEVDFVLKCHQSHHGKEAHFVIKVMVKFVIVMVKVFIKVPYIICTGDACQTY